VLTSKFKCRFSQPSCEDCVAVIFKYVVQEFEIKFIVLNYQHRLWQRRP
jgi:hypothetical protein